MHTVSISDIHKDSIIVDSTVIVSGWIRSCRKSKSDFSFLTIYDGSCFWSIQVIATALLPNYKNEILRLTVGCSVKIQGILVASPGKEQKYEIQAKRVKVLGWVYNPPTYPVSAKRHTKEYLREYAHLRSRTNFIGSISRIRHHALQAFHLFLSQEGYYWVPTPIITALNAEGSGEMFRVSTLDINNIFKNKKGFVDFKKDFFGKESFLTVSGQLTLESYACALSKVYNFGPTFRAENSNTSRHLAEFWMLEVESAFYDLYDISHFAEKMLKNITQSILLNCSSDINFLNHYINNNLIKRLEQLSSVNFIQIDYHEAIKILNTSNSMFKNSVSFGTDLSAEHERYLVEKYFQVPVIIKNYPKTLKAFYMRLNDDNKTVAAIDILVPGIGELIGGSQREERIDFLDFRLSELGLHKEDYWWYLDLRRYGTVPHSGFGMGFERFLSYVTGVSNIRDVIPFPRTVNNANF